MSLAGLGFLMVYGLAKSYSSAIVAYVVEQALLQKAPPEVKKDDVRARLNGTLAPLTRGDKILKLLALSSYIEKVQKLTPAELDRLLPKNGPAGGANH